jgi:NitT/TauT family transport system permease protein
LQVAEALLGLLIAIVVGVGLGAVFVIVPILRKVVMPIIVGLQAMPKIAIAPLFIVWMGYSPSPKILMAFLLSFFPIIINTVIGLTSVDQDQIDLIRSMEGGSSAIYRFVRVPSAMPAIVGGIQVAVSLALIGAIVGEFVGAQSGLGYLILVAGGNSDTALIFAAILVLTVIGIVLYGIVTVLGGIVTRWNRPTPAS